ncbi:MAG: hypothetical protein MJE66_07285, partial [Proteobacteria bacterium]|nr:hypothetical protein [Pseudomonadota bacterium]
ADACWAARPESAAAAAVSLRLRQELCVWSELAPRARAVRRAVRAGEAAISPFAWLDTHDDPADHARCAALWSAGLACRPEPRRATVSSGSDRLSLGYLSADFGEHAVGHALAALLPHHDRTRVRVLGYRLGRGDGSALGRELANACDSFRELGGLGDAAAADRIARDGVDVLVDLMGATRGGRPEILMRRPAPVQVSYLGHPGTLGSDAVDYLFADACVAPPELEPYLHEAVVRLPGSYQIGEPPRAAAALPTRRDCDLPDDAFVFCSFQRASKLTARLFAVWLELLRARRKAMLWLAPHPAAVQTRLRAAAAARGVAPERLVFAERKPHAAYAAQYRLADLVLDTHPYNGHGTHVDALLQGCPLLTRPGRSFHARVGASLLSDAGFRDGIASTWAAYRERALAWSADPAAWRRRRDAFEARVRARPPFGGARAARAIEDACLHMRERAAAGRAPVSFAVSDVTDKYAVKPNPTGAENEGSATGRGTRCPLTT